MQPLARLVKGICWRLLGEEMGLNKYLKTVAIITGMVIGLYFFSNTALYLNIFGLGSSDTCFDFKKSSSDTQVNFLLECGCLTEELSDMMNLFDMKDKVHDCFINKVRTCVGSEQIGDIYRECTKFILKNDYKNADIEEVYWQNRKRMNEFLKKSGVEPFSDKQVDQIMIESYKDAYNKAMNQ